jgi:hypothetical protein
MPCMTSRTLKMSDLWMKHYGLVLATATLITLYAAASVFFN